MRLPFVPGRLRQRVPDLVQRVPAVVRRAASGSAGRGSSNAARAVSETPSFLNPAGANAAAVSMSTIGSFLALGANRRGSLASGTFRHSQSSAAFESSSRRDSVAAIAAATSASPNPKPRSFSAADSASAADADRASSGVRGSFSSSASASASSSAPRNKPSTRFRFSSLMCSSCRSRALGFLARRSRSLGVRRGLRGARALPRLVVQEHLLVLRGEQALQREVARHLGERGDGGALRGFLLGRARLVAKNHDVLVRLVLVGQHHLARPPGDSAGLSTRGGGLLLRDVPWLLHVLLLRDVLLQNRLGVLRGGTENRRLRLAVPPHAVAAAPGGGFVGFDEPAPSSPSPLGGTAAAAAAASSTSLAWCFATCCFSLSCCLNSRSQCGHGSSFGLRSFGFTVLPIPAAPLATIPRLAFAASFLLKFSAER